MVTLNSIQPSLESFQLRDEIYFLNTCEALINAHAKLLWEQAALSSEQSTYTSGTGQPGGIWKQIPQERHFSAILDIGCGYGRHAAYLSKQKKITCDRYYGVDISENMLRRLQTYRAAYNFFPSAEFSLLCMPVGELPFADNSIDFVMSSSVFIHLGKERVQKILSEVARVIKPNGTFILENSFFNQYCPAHIIHNFIRLLKPSPSNQKYLKQFSFKEIDALLKSSQLAQKCPQYTINPLKPALLPETLGSVALPFAMRVNNTINPPNFLKGMLARGYSVYSELTTEE